jgi:hypothetical protein
MPQPIVYVDVSDIREEKFEQLTDAMNQLAVFVEANVPRLISYGFFLNEDRTQMTVVAVHPDCASLDFHLDKGRAEFQKFTDLITLTRIDVYGRISAAVLDRLRHKVRMLGSGDVTVHHLHAGFSR